MGKIYDNLDELIGHTPMVALKAMDRLHETTAEVFAKLEWYNPGGSSKDRAALKILDEAERAGIIRRGVSVLIEPTDGNMGIGLMTVAAGRKYSTIAVAPENIPEEKKKLLDAHGAQIVFTDAAKGMKGAVEKARELAGTTEHAWMPNQFENPSGVKAHYETTGPEIWEDMDGRIDAFVCCAGSGATIMGAGKYLKEKNPAVQIIAVRPVYRTEPGRESRHDIPGIDTGFEPPLIEPGFCDEVIEINQDMSYMKCYDLAATEGYLAGISSGTALHAAYDVAIRPEMAGKRIVVLLPDSADRYLSTELYAEPEDEDEEGGE